LKLQLSYTKSALTSIYVTSLDGYDNEIFANQILEIGDKQNRLTNVKADMTEWLLTDYESFRSLGIDIVVNHLPHLYMPPIDGSGFDWIITSLWGVSYKKGDHTIFHDHSPSTFSFCYYVRTSKESSPLIFSDIDYELLPKENDLIIFPSHLKHGVPLQISDSERIVISGNLNAMTNNVI